MSATSMLMCESRRFAVISHTRRAVCGVGSASPHMQGQLKAAQLGIFYQSTFEYEAIVNFVAFSSLNVVRQWGIYAIQKRPCMPEFI